MALPTSGPLSILDIVNELSTQFDLVPPYGLRNLSSLVGFSTPDSISEFYGYGAAVLSYYFSMSAIAGGNMYVYKNKSLVVSVSSDGASGTISASSGDNFDVEVYSYGYAMSTCVARIYYPAVYAIPQAEASGGGYAGASYSFTYNGTNATITGNAFTY